MEIMSISPEPKPPSKRHRPPWRDARLTDDPPPAFLEVCDRHRPLWLDLIVAQFFKYGLFDLQEHIREKTIPGVDWEHPAIRYYIGTPWKREGPGKSMMDEVRNTVIRTWRSRGKSLGDAFQYLLQIGVCEYLTRRAGYLLLDQKEAHLVESARLDRMNRMTPEEKERCFQNLFAPLTLGEAGEKEIEPLFSTPLAIAQAKELNRVRRAFAPYLEFPGASMTMKFYPFVVDKNQEMATFSYSLGLELSEEMRQKAAETSGWCFCETLFDAADFLREWAAMEPHGVPPKGIELDLEPEANLKPEIWEIFEEDLRKYAKLQVANLAYTGELAPFRQQVGAETGEKRSGPIPEKHAAAKSAYREFLATRERDLGFADLFHFFWAQWPDAAEKTGDEMQLVKETLRKKHNEYWEATRGISQNKPTVNTEG